MAPLLFALLLLAQDGAAATAPADGPLATALPRKQDVAPLPIQGGPVAPPTDDYGYVAWCLGAVGGYVDLYDRAMPEVIRIERAWPTPSTEENIKEVYPGQKKDAVADIALFKRAIEAAEKASPTPIAIQGAAAIKKGRALWTGSNTVPKAQLAQFWMSWSPPAKCTETAKALEQRSNLFGQALTYNAKPADKPAEAAPSDEARPALAALTPLGMETGAPETAKTADEDAPQAVAETVETTKDEPAKDEPAAIVDDAPAADDAASAIDDLVSAATDESAAAEAPAPAAEDEAKQEETAPEEAAPQAKAPAEATAKPASAGKTAKPGLKDTLKGLRGRQ